VQTGSQNRSNKAVQAAMTFLHEGRLGEIYMAKAVVYRPREPFGLSQPAEIPEGVDYGLWLGPTEWYDFDKNRFHYNWHWFWNTGNGETGNNGVHYTDLLRWGCQRDDHPYKIQSMGGYYLFEDECIQETPNTQMSVMQYDDGLEFQVEVRNWHTHLDGDVQMGVHFYGSEGWLSLIPHGNSWTTHFGFHHDGRPGPEMRIEPPEGVDPHFLNFIDAVRSRNHEDLNADIEDGHKAATLCHLCNIAYRVGRTVMFDSATETFPDDYIAQDLVSREYREPFVMPDEI
jgi:predicted dehydrogenase